MSDEPSAVKLAYDIVAIAASAGGLYALNTVLEHLPASFPTALMVVQHLDPHHASMMSKLLGRNTGLKVKEAQNGEPILAGTVYIGAPDRHMLVNTDRTVLLTQTAPVKFVRPSADLMFVSVAAVYHNRAIAVVLTGSGSDGSIGVQAIRKEGGVVIAQDETTSEYFGMPGSAIRTNCVDEVLALREIASRLVVLVTEGNAP